MNKVLIITIFILLQGSTLQAQIWDSLNHHGLEMSRDSFIDYRLGHFNKFKTLVDSIAKEDIESLKQLDYVHFIEPEEKDFTIVSYSFRWPNSRYSYYMILRDQESLESFEYTLDDQDEFSSYENYSLDNWYGAIYYNLISKKVKGKRVHFLFGYRTKDAFTNQKFIEVLSKTDGKYIFGKENLFDSDNIRGPIKRFIVEYYSKAIVRLNFHPEQNRILFDHLISFPTPKGFQMVPDGSYEGFEWKRKMWSQIKKAFHQVSETPPMSSEASERKKADLFGQKRSD